MDSRERLIIFTRYPDPGKAKTRLIPALGPDGAADLHRQMAEHTLAQARSLATSRPVQLEVQFPVGAPERMQTWLGSDIPYRRQQGDDLGDRMAHAFETAFQAGNTSVIIIGTDCPDLDAMLLQKAFQELQQHDLVLGPAVDGGYYLIGLRQPVPELFGGIAWSTDAVLRQTLASADRLALKSSLLPMLADVDYPDDLAIWQRVSTPISVIIPTLNEAAHLAQTLSLIRVASAVEVIVVDAGSQDATIAIAKSQGVRVLSAPAGRANQMNVGAQAATGEILVFLHADTRLPLGFDALIRQTLTQPNVVAGAFCLNIEGNTPGLRLIEWGVNWRSRLFHLPYGDQAIFLKASTFRESGGFANLPIMEDFEFVRRINRRGQVAIVPAAVLTSGRRWQQLGLLRTTLLNQCIILAYYLGVSPQRLAHWYRGKPSRD